MSMNDIRPDRLLHVYVNGERLSREDGIGYIHINATGVTLGSAKDLDLALQAGIVAGLMFVDLNNGDKAVVCTDIELFGEACRTDPEFMAQMQAQISAATRNAMEESIRSALNEALAEAARGSGPRRSVTPGSRIMRALVDPNVSVEEFEQVVAQERANLGSLGPDMDDLIEAEEAGEDDCDCPACQLRRFLESQQ